MAVSAECGYNWGGFAGGSLDYQPFERMNMRKRLSGTRRRSKWAFPVMVGLVAAYALSIARRKPAVAAITVVGNQQKITGS